jgi:N-acetylmuramidase
LIPLPPGQNPIADTWNDYGGLILQQAHALGIEPDVAMAVVVTESPGGAPFGADGRMIVRFEPHIFREQWGERHAERFQQHFQLNEEQTWNGKFHRWRANPDAPWTAFHGNQALEWQVLSFARSLDDTAALRSSSLGAPQIMGFNHEYLAYGTVQEMFSAFSQDALAQYRGLFAFIRAREVVENLQTGDYVGFARVYNGPAWAQGYADLIESNLAAFRQLQSHAAARAVQPATEAVPLPAQLPMPVIDQSLKELDPELYAAWREHIIQGFQNNQTMFRRVLNSFMYPYWITVAMYAALFTVGIAAFVVAVVLAFRGGESTASVFGSTAIFGGLTALAFLSYFLSRPLQALEENLQFITWLGMIYNSYWTRLAYAQDATTIQADIEDITDDAIAKLNALLDKHGERSGKRPNAG